MYICLCLDNQRWLTDIATHHSVTIVMHQKQDLVKKLKFSRLPRCLHLQQMTDGINFKDRHICYEHFSKGYWDSTDDIPDFTIPACQVSINEIKYEKEKERYVKFQNPKESDDACHQETKCKLGRM